MLQKYTDEKYNHDDDQTKSNIWLWVFLIVGIIIMIILMRRLAIKLNRRISYIRNHFRGFIKRIFIIGIIFFTVLIGGIWLLNLGTRKKRKKEEDGKDILITTRI